MKGYNCYDLETVIHNLVSDKNHKGEWFQLDNEDLIRIISYCSKLIN